MLRCGTYNSAIDFINKATSLGEPEVTAPIQYQRGRGRALQYVIHSGSLEGCLKEMHLVINLAPLSAKAQAKKTETDKYLEKKQEEEKNKQGSCCRDK